MSKAVLVTLDFQGATRIVNLPDGINPQDPATVAQLEAALAGIAWKDNCRVGTGSNINLTSPGASLDGITMAASDRVLVRSQTLTRDNGIYIWNGAAVPMTRDTKADTMTELKNAVASVDEGSDAATTWRQTSVTGVIGTDPVVWATFGVVTPDASETVAGKIELATLSEVNAGADAVRAVTPATLAASDFARKKFAADIGDGSATTYVLTHNFGTRDVLAQIYRTTGNYDNVECGIRRTTINSVTVEFDVAPTSNQFRGNIGK